MNMDLTKRAASKTAALSTPVAKSLAAGTLNVTKTAVVKSGPKIVKTGRFMFDDVIRYYVLQVISWRTVMSLAMSIFVVCRMIYKAKNSADALVWTGFAFLAAGSTVTYLWYFQPHRWLYFAATLLGIAATWWGGGTPMPCPREKRVKAVKVSEQDRIEDLLDVWDELAMESGLEGTSASDSTETASGLDVEISLSAKWTPASLAKQSDVIRSMLQLDASTRVRITPGRRGNVAILHLGLKSAADGDLKWSPGAAFGVNEVTGDQVHIPLGQRLVIAGRSGAGKTWGTREFLYRASEGPTNALVMVDFKFAEGRLWKTRGRARVADDPRSLSELTAELTAEHEERMRSLPDGDDVLIPSKRQPRLTVFVDEGAQIVNRKDTKDAVDELIRLAGVGRSSCIDIVWCTQFPTRENGIPQLVDVQAETRIGYALSMDGDDLVVFGKDALKNGWLASKLKTTKTVKYALVRTGDSAPDPIVVREFDNATLKKLPPTQVWQRTDSQVSARQRDREIVVDAIAIMKSLGLDRMSTADLLGALSDIDEKYEDLSALGMTARFKAAGVSREQDRVMINKVQVRGWLLEDLRRVC